MPTEEMGLQLAFGPHCASSLPGLHIRAQNLVPEVSCRAHVGVAWQPGGTSVGQVVPIHSGVQKSPDTPVIWMASSSSLQPFGLGSS